MLTKLHFTGFGETLKLTIAAYAIFVRRRNTNVHALFCDLQIRVLELTFLSMFRDENEIRPGVSYAFFTLTNTVSKRAGPSPVFGIYGLSLKQK